MEHQDLTSPQYAPLWGGVMAFLRAWYRGRRWKARFLEGMMLAVAMLGVVPVLRWLGLPDNLAIAFAAWSGYVGVDTLATWAGQKMGTGNDVSRNH